MGAWGGNPSDWGVLGTFAQDTMNFVANQFSTGTLTVQGVSPSVVRNAPPFFVMDDVFADEAYPTQQPAVRWKWTGGIADGTNIHPGGVATAGQPNNTTGSLGTWFMDYEVTCFGRTGFEAYNEMNYILWALDKQLARPPMFGKTMSCELVESAAESGFNRSIKFKFMAPIEIPYPATTTVTVLTASFTSSIQVPPALSGSIFRILTTTSGSNYYRGR